MRPLLLFFLLLTLFPGLTLLRPPEARAQDEQPVLPADLPTAVFPPPPRLAMTGEELKTLQAAPDFMAKREAAVKAASAFLQNSLVLPEGHGGWIFDYACPDDGSTLRAKSATEHHCPRCGKIYSDDKTNIAYRAQLHYNAENAVQALGLAFAYTAEKRYAEEARRILLHLAKAYPGYPQRLDRWGNSGELARLGGRRFVQSLDEAVGIIRLAKGYDLTRTSLVWSDGDRRLVEENLFRLTTHTLLQFNQDINNHQTWYNAGLMAIASVLADAKLAAQVLSMRGGYYDQLNRSVGRDGLWYEGTMAYQNYALQAVREIVDAGMKMGLPLHREPKLKILLLGPLRVAYPDGSFPVINDSDPNSIRTFDWSFEWARKIYDDPGFATDQASAQSEKLEDAGLAILRQGEGEAAAAVFLDYGPHGGGHGHRDKLSITLFANGAEWLLDPGRLSYSHKEYKTWVKETAAHNTVTRHGKSQRPTTGRLLWLQSGDGYAACAAESDGAYLGVLLRRSLFMTPQFLIDVFEVEGEDPAQTDWLVHASAAAVVPVEASRTSTPATLGDSEGYQHLSDARSWSRLNLSRWDFIRSEGEAESPRLRLWFLDTVPTQEYTALGIGYSLAQKTPTLVRRRSAGSTRYITLYDLSGRGDAVQKLEQKGDALLVTTRTGKREVVFSSAGVQTHFVAD